jgi:hypothetical protein
VAGEIASLFISRMAVPVLYSMAARRKPSARVTSVDAHPPLPSQAAA